MSLKEGVLYLPQKDNMQVIGIFCLSYLGFPLVQRYVDASNVKVVAFIRTKEQERFLKEYFPSVCFHRIPYVGEHELARRLTKKAKIEEMIVSLVQELSNFEINTLIFTDSSFCAFEWALFKRMQVIGHKVVIPSINYPLKYPLSYGFRDWMICGALRYLLAIGVSPKANGQKTYFQISKSEFKQYKVEQHTKHSLRLQHSAKYPTGDVLWLSGSVVEEGIVSRNDYETSVNELLNSISIVMKMKIWCKAHPRYSATYGLETSLPQIPAYIPAPLICSGFRCVIGYSSSTLFEAARSGALAISTMKCIPTSDPQRTKMFIKYLEDNEPGVVMYPNSLKSIVDLLVDMRK